MDTVSEGKAKIIIGNAFYNPKMKRLRDISVTFLNSMLDPGFKVLDATAATGIRGIRYLLEANAGRAVFLEINSEAYSTLVENIRLNRVEERAEAKNTSIQEFANTTNERFDAIDLDPFGTPAPYIFDLLKLAKQGTILMITATDTATLCGAEGNACLRIYGAKPISGGLCHEGSVRILLGFLAKLASQFNFGIRPLLSLAELHYIRLFVELSKGAREAVKSMKETGFVSLCRRCHSYYLAKHFCGEKIEYSCRFCGSSTEQFGPMWLGPINDRNLALEMEKEADEKTKPTFAAIAAEVESPFFYNLDEISSYLNLGSVSVERVLLKLKEKRINASRTVFCGNCIKTNAGISAIIDSIKEVAKSALSSN